MFKSTKIDQFILNQRIFQFFGLYFPDSKNKKFASKLEKFCAYYGYIYYFLNIIVGIGIGFVIYVRIKNQLKFSEDFMLIITFWFIYFECIFSFILNFLQRKSERKLDKHLKEANALIRNNLKYPRISQKFRILTRPLSIYLIIYFGLATANHFRVADPKIQLFTPSVKFMTFHLHLIWIKFLLYGNTIAQQLDMLLDSRDFSSVNFIIYQRVLTQIWMAFKKINKVFEYQMILCICRSMSSAIFIGYVISSDILENKRSFDPFMYIIVSIFGITMISLNCQMCYDKVFKSLCFEFLSYSFYIFST